MMIWILLACNASEKPAPTPSPVPVSTPAAPLYSFAGQDLDIVVVSMDCLRYDRTGLDPKNPGKTPNLNAFADSSVVFHDAMSAAAWTVPSHMSIWTGRFPSRHGLVNKLAPGPDGKLVDASLAENVPTHPDKLIAAGFTAAAFTGDAGVSKRFGYGRGFSEFLDDKKFGAMDHSGPPAKTWLEANKDKKFFLFFHGYDTHGQAPLPEGTDLRALDPDYKGSLDGSIGEQAKLREEALSAIQKPGESADLKGKLSKEDWHFLMSVYDEKIRRADERVGEFIQTLKATGVWDHAIVAIVSDHGEEFGEHGAIDHGYSIYQEQLHVPLMIHFPGQTKRQDIQQTVRTLDLFPTIFDALGLPAMPDIDGSSLLPLIRGMGAAPGPLIAESDYRLFVHLRAIREGNYKLILDLSDGQKQLFDLSADPGETKDLSTEQPKVAYELEQKLRAELLTWQVDPAIYLGKSEEKITVY
jgi:arylsulfatase A-like enzyme